MVAVDPELDFVCSSSSGHCQMGATLFEMAAPLALEEALEKAMVWESLWEVDQLEACWLQVQSQVQVQISWA